MNQFKFFDTHSHLNFSDFNEDREEVIKKTLENGVKIIIVSVSFEDSKKAVEIASRYERGVYASVGLHPTDKGQLEEVDWESYKKLASQPKVVAIGECGLDAFKRKAEDLERQKEIFNKQIGLALELDMPVIVHCRDTHEEILDILSVYKNPKLRGVIHFFSGSFEQARKYFDLGFLISFTGVITFTRDYDEVIKKAPLEKIMAETDAPFVAPMPYRGQRNEPLYVKEVIKKIAEIKGISIEEAAKATTDNARRLFGI